MNKLVRRKLLLIIAAAIGGIAILVAILIVQEMPREGAVDSIIALPRYGDRFPKDFVLRNIKYRYEPARTSLFLTGEATPKQVEYLCAEWGYELRKNEVWSYSVSYKVANAKFVPSGDDIWRADGGLSPSARHSVFVYFMPDSTGAAGKMIVHIIK